MGVFGFETEREPFEPENTEEGRTRKDWLVWPWINGKVIFDVCNTRKIAYLGHNVSTV